MQYFRDNIQDKYGNARAGLFIEVLQGTDRATIYSDNGVTPKANPLTSSVDGTFDFYAANGTYTLKLSNSNGIISNTTIVLFDPADAAAGTAARYAPLIIGYNATSLADGAVVVFAGRTSANDGGGGAFTYSANSTQPADNGLVFAPTGGGRLFRQGWTVSGFKGPVFVEYFGAVGGGAVDDCTAIQAACDALGAYGGGELWFTNPVYGIGVELVVSASVRFKATGWGDTSTSSSAPDTFLNKLLWIGGVDTSAVMRVQSSTANAFVYDWGIDGLCIDGNNKAYVGIRLSSCRKFRIGTLWAQRCRFFGVVIDDGNGVLAGAFGTCQEYQYLAGANAACASSGGLKITSSTGAGATSMLFQHIVTTTVNGDGVDVGDCDSTTFGKVHNVVTGTGHGFFWRGLTDGQTRVSRKNTVREYSGGWMYAEAGSLNTVVRINSESTSLTIEANAVVSVHEIIDRNDGRRWRTPSYLTNDTKQVGFATGYNPGGSASLTIHGGMDMQVVSLPASGTNGWQWVLPPVREWSGGRITGFRVWGFKWTNTNTGNIVLLMQVKSKSTRAGIGGVFSTVRVVHAVDAAGALTLDAVSGTLATPVNTFVDDHVIVNITRDKTDSSDTYPDPWCLLSVGVNYQADVANSDSPHYRYGFPADQIV